MSASDLHSAPPPSAAVPSPQPVPQQPPPCPAWWQKRPRWSPSSLNQRTQLLLLALLIPLTLALLLPSLLSSSHPSPSTSPSTSLLHRLLLSLTPHPLPHPPTSSHPTPHPTPSTWRLVNNTAEGVALLRYLAALDPSSPIHPSEQRALELLLPPHLLTLASHPSTRSALRRGALPGVYEAVVGRTQAIDEVVSKALNGGGGGGKGLEQVVVLGAGSDTRGLRFHPELVRGEEGGGVRWFEVDLPDEQARKQAKLAQALQDGRHLHTKGDLQPAMDHIRYVPLNLTQAAARSDPSKSSLLPPLWQALYDAGYSDAAPTLFIMEGLTAYLPPAVVNDTLHSLHHHAPLASVLVLDLFAGDAQCREGEEWTLMLEALQGMGEPVQFVLEVKEEGGARGGEEGKRRRRREVAGWLSKQGWHLLELEGPDELEARLPQKEGAEGTGGREGVGKGKGEERERVACYEQVATARNKPIEIDTETIEP